MCDMELSVQSAARRVLEVRDRIADVIRRDLEQGNNSIFAGFVGAAVRLRPPPGMYAAGSHL